MALSDNLQLISYLTVAEIFDQGKSIFDSFLPIVESALISKIHKESVSFLALQQELNETYFLSVPKSTLRCLLDRLHQQGKIIFNDRNRIILNKNALNREFWENREARETAVEDFFLEFNNFLTQKGIHIPFSDIKSQCCNWLYLNSLDLATFISKGKLEEKQPQSIWIYANQLLAFLLQIYSEKSIHYNTFLYIYNGAVQASLLNFEPKQIDNVCESEIKMQNVILDTNFILRILNLQSEFDVACATETLRYLTDRHTKFYVLKQTIEEIQKSIKKFLTDIEPYTAQTRTYLQGFQIQMSGFWEAHRRGISKTEFVNLANSEKLKKAIQNHIEVEFIEDFDDTSILKEDMQSLIESKNRPSYFEKSARHDLALIEYCRKFRKKHVLSAADVDWWVLTNDERLAYWNQHNCGDYQECMTEVQFSNLLWFQKRRSVNNGLMQTIVSLSNYTAVSPQSIAQFAHKIHYYQEKHKDDEEQLDKFSLLLASNMLTAEDIKRINSEEEALDKVIEEKVFHIQLEQKIQQQKFSETKEEGARLTTQNEQLSRELSLITTKLEIEKLERQIDGYNQNIKDSNIECSQSKEYLSNYLKLNEFVKTKSGSTARLVCMFLAISLLLVIFAYFKYGCPLIVDQFESINIMPEFLQNILGGLVIPCVLILLYYFAVVMVFKTPMSPKELFLVLCSKLLDARLLRFMRKTGISFEYKSTNLEGNISSTEHEIQSIEHRISSWESAVANAKGQIELLNKMSA